MLALLAKEPSYGYSCGRGWARRWVRWGTPSMPGRSTSRLGRWRRRVSSSCERSSGLADRPDRKVYELLRLASNEWLTG